MHATSISLTNFRRFEQFDAQFDRYFTLLMGANGSGKTSLLKGIHVGLSSLSQAANVGLIGQGLADTDVRCQLSVDPADESWRTPVFPCRVKLPIWLDGADRLFGMERLPQSTEVFLSDNDHADSMRSFEVIRTWSPTWFSPTSSEPTPIIARYGASNARGDGAAGTVQRPFSSKQEIWQRFNQDVVETSWLAQWFQYNELRTLQEHKEPLVYRQVRQAVLSAIHAKDVKYVVRDNQLMLLHEGQGWRPFNQLSDGQRRIAAIFCDLALRCASLNSQLGETCISDTPGIVTIDELDLHLHPSWQRSVVGDLRRVFPQIQFIVTSHSPFLLQAAFEHGQVVDMASGQFVQPGDTSLEDITEGVMGVDQPQRGVKFLALKRTAAEYIRLLETSASTPEEIARVKAELDGHMAHFANDPASAAWLAQQREAAGL